MQQSCSVPTSNPISLAIFASRARYTRTYVRTYLRTYSYTTSSGRRALEEKWTRKRQDTYWKLVSDIRCLFLFFEYECVPPNIGQRFFWHPIFNTKNLGSVLKCHFKKNRRVQLVLYLSQACRDHIDNTSFDFRRNGLDIHALSADLKSKDTQQ